MDRIMNYVYMVYQEKSFTKAAEKLYISQPALSAMVKKAESDIHATIFDRSTTPISLTADGVQYIKFVEEFMEIQRRMDEYFNPNGSSLGNDIRVGGTSFFCSYIFPSVIQSFRQSFPNANFQFMEAKNVELADHLVNGDIDLFMEVDEIERKGISYFSWGKEALLLAVPKHFAVNETLRNLALTAEEIQANVHMDNTIPGVQMRAFKGEPFILLREGNDSYNRALEICRKQGFLPNVFMKMDSLLTCSLLASEGHGVAFVRDEILGSLLLENKLFFYKIDDPLAIRDIYVYFQEQGTAKQLVKSFLSFMRNHPFRSNQLAVPPFA